MSASNRHGAAALASLASCALASPCGLDGGAQRELATSSAIADHTREDERFPRVRARVDGGSRGSNAGVGVVVAIAAIAAHSTRSRNARAMPRTV
jgi:hypothetical protein